MRLSRAVLTAASPALQTFQTAAGTASTADIPTVGTGGGNAGYLGNTSNLIKVELHLTVRKITCIKRPMAPIFVQVDINGTLANRDFGASGMHIGESCIGTTPNYGATLVVDGTNEASVTPSPGDVLSFAGTVKKRAESYSLTDLTTTQSVSDTGTGLSPQNVQLTVQGGFSGRTDFPPFTPPIVHSDIRVNRCRLLHAQSGCDLPAGCLEQCRDPDQCLSTAGNAFSLTYVTNK